MPVTSLLLKVNYFSLCSAEQVSYERNKIASFLYHAAQQFSYERSSQAQSSIYPPNLLTAAGELDSRRLAFRVG